MSTDQKLSALQQWQKQEQRALFPTELLPDDEDLEALLARESLAMTYFLELLYAMTGEMYAIFTEIVRLRTAMEVRT